MFILITNKSELGALLYANYWTMKVYLPVCDVTLSCVNHLIGFGIRHTESLLF